MIWKTVRRETGLIEHTCEHGVGHTNPASAIRIASMCIDDELYHGNGILLDEAIAWTIHGCDGCCNHPSFPGHIFNNLCYAFGLYEGDQNRADCLYALNKFIYDRLDVLYQYASIDEPLVEQMRQGYMDMVKLQKLVDRIFFDPDEELRFKTKCEFMYWPLKQLVLFRDIPDIPSKKFEDYYERYIGEDDEFYSTSY